MLRVSYLLDGSSSYEYGNVDKLSKTCPYCNIGVEVESRSGFLTGDILQLVFKCPRSECGHVYVGVYNKPIFKNPLSLSDFTMTGTEPKVKYMKRKVDDRIRDISPSFEKIFNEAEEAESLGLDNISGIGYRKSLEFLIKDYLISKNPEKSEDIGKKTLSNCIQQDVDDHRIKSMATKAAWLGNDETHYVRRHVSMSIDDLKALIEITQYWICMEIASEEYENAFPGTAHN